MALSHEIMFKNNVYLL